MNVVNTRGTLGCLIVSLTFMLPGAALGQSRPHKAVRPAAAPATPTKAAPLKVKAVKETVKRQPQRLTFGDDLVEAGRAGGGGMLIKGRVKPKHSKLIPIRVDFVPELIKSANFI